MDSFKEARETLNLSEKASMAEIQKRFRELSFRYHPDHCSEEPEICKEKFARIKESYDVLMEYCFNFPIPLDEESYRKYSKEGKYRQYLNQFFDGWWGDIT
jgi:preprotein translocase subunit Sec63